MMKRLFELIYALMINYIVHLYHKWHCWRDLRHLVRLGMVEMVLVGGVRGARITPQGREYLQTQRMLNLKYGGMR